MKETGRGERNLGSSSGSLKDSRVAIWVKQEIYGKEKIRGMREGMLETWFELF